MCITTIIADDFAMEFDKALGAYRTRIFQRGVCVAEIISTPKVMQAGAFGAIQAIEETQGRSAAVLAFAPLTAHADTA